MNSICLLEPAAPPTAHLGPRRRGSNPSHISLPIYNDPARHVCGDSLHQASRDAAAAATGFHNMRKSHCWYTVFFLFFFSKIWSGFVGCLKVKLVQNKEFQRNLLAWNWYDQAGNQVANAQGFKSDFVNSFIAYFLYFFSMHLFASLFWKVLQKWAVYCLVFWRKLNDIDASKGGK